MGGIIGRKDPSEPFGVHENHAGQVQFLHPSPFPQSHALRLVPNGIILTWLRSRTCNLQRRTPPDVRRRAQLYVDPRTCSFACFLCLPIPLPRTQRLTLLLAPFIHPFLHPNPQQTLEAIRSLDPLAFPAHLPETGRVGPNLDKWFGLFTKISALRHTHEFTRSLCLERKEYVERREGRRI